MIGTIVRKVIGPATGVTIVGSTGGLLYMYETDEGTKRAIQAYGTFIPVVVAYRWLEAKDKWIRPVSDEEWLALDQKYAQPTVTKLGQLQGMYCKYGQTAAGFTNTFSDEWIHQLRTLEDQVPPRPIYVVVETIREETIKLQQQQQQQDNNKNSHNNNNNNTIHNNNTAPQEKKHPLQGRMLLSVHEGNGNNNNNNNNKNGLEIFESFDENCLGSASIGQVHKAKLSRSNSSSSNNNNNKQQQDVAVKIQYPEAERLFRDDMHAIRLFCTMFAPEHIVLLDALEKQNAAELDYIVEAHHMMEIHNNMKQAGFVPEEIRIPQPIMEYTTSRMLVMEYIPGQKLIDGMEEYATMYAKETLGLSSLEEYQQQVRKHIEEHGIPAKYDGPSANQIEWYRRYCTVRDTMKNIPIALYNAILQRGDDNKKKIPYHKTILPPNTPRIIDTLMRVHGYQLLKNGIFNADPHGGNFILCPDGKTIGCIDYGATKRFTRNERLMACVLFVALHKMDERMLFDMCEIGGYKSKYGNKDVLLKLLQFGYDSYGKDVTGGKNVQQFIDELKERDPWEEVPDNFVMAQFMSIRLRSLALGMNHPIKCSDYWGPMAEQILIEEGLPYETWDYSQLVQYQPELNMQKHKMTTF